MVVVYFHVRRSVFRLQHISLTLLEKIDHNSMHFKFRVFVCSVLFCLFVVTCTGVWGMSAAHACITAVVSLCLSLGEVKWRRFFCDFVGEFVSHLSTGELNAPTFSWSLYFLDPVLFEKLPTPKDVSMCLFKGDCVTHILLSNVGKCKKKNKLVWPACCHTWCTPKVIGRLENRKWGGGAELIPLY